MRAFGGRRAILAALVLAALAAGVALALWFRGLRASPPLFDPAVRNPFPRTQESLAIGERVYRAHCEACHGVSGRGNGPGAAGLSPRPVDFRIHLAMGHSDALLFYWISYGMARTAMPAFARRLSNADIAQRVHLSEGTVRNYVSTILSKLGVADRTQAAVLALRAGLLEQGDSS